MDRTGANFDKVVGQLRSRLGAYAVPMQVPVGAEDGFDGVIDLLKMQRIHWDTASQGTVFEYGELPAELAEKAAEARSFMVAAAAEANEALLAKYRDRGRLREAGNNAGRPQRPPKVEHVPVFYDRSFTNTRDQA